MYTIDILLSKVHGIAVTEADLNYTGSLTLDCTIMEAAKMIQYRKIFVVNNDNEERLETYLPEKGEAFLVDCEKYKSLAQLMRNALQKDSIKRELMKIRT